MDRPCMKHVMGPCSVGDHAVRASHIGDRLNRERINVPLSRGAWDWPGRTEPRCGSPVASPQVVRSSRSGSASSIDSLMSLKRPVAKRCGADRRDKTSYEN
jgi:hypothetical protein